MNQPQVRDSARSSPKKESSRQGPARVERKQEPASQAHQLDTDIMLDAAYNRLQELMQLLYLLSRDASVPTDARYHVTIAQSEIALLSRIVHNSAGGEADAARSQHSL